LPAPYKATRRVAGAGNVGEGGVGMAQAMTEPTEPRRRRAVAAGAVTVPLCGVKSVTNRRATDGTAGFLIFFFFIQ